MSAAVELPLHDPSQWPLRMTRAEVAHVLRCSIRSLERRVVAGRLPRWDSDWMWDRDTVARYARGGIRQFDAMVARHGRRRRRLGAAEAS